jgi:hypothetical protein
MSRMATTPTAKPIQGRGGGIAPLDFVLFGVEVAERFSSSVCLMLYS